MLEGMGLYLIRSKILEISEVKGEGLGLTYRMDLLPGGVVVERPAGSSEGGALRCFLKPRGPEGGARALGALVSRQWDVPMGNSKGIYENCYGPKG